MSMYSLFDLFSRRVTLVRSSLDRESDATLIHAFVTSRLDYGSLMRRELHV